MDVLIAIVFAVFYAIYRNRIAKVQQEQRNKTFKPTNTQVSQKPIQQQQNQEQNQQRNQNLNQQRTRQGYRQAKKMEPYITQRNVNWHLQNEQTDSQVGYQSGSQTGSYNTSSPELETVTESSDMVQASNYDMSPTFDPERDSNDGIDASIAAMQTDIAAFESYLSESVAELTEDVTDFEHQLNEITPAMMISHKQQPRKKRISINKSNVMQGIIWSQILGPKFEEE